MIVEGSKDGYIESVIDITGMSQCKAVQTAGARQTITSASDEEYIGEQRHRQYRAVCGKLQSASPRRPYILYTLKEPGRWLQRPRECDWKLMKHLVRYLQGTKDLVLCMRSDGSADRIIAQSDSDWAG